jgi:heat shock protein HspQ
MAAARPLFGIGDIVHHARFGYRGVVVDVDPVFSLTEEWYDQVARSRPPKDKPWYHVLVDGAAHVTYVAERHLEPHPDRTQIDHPELGRFFSRYDGRRYIPRGTAH